MANAADVVQQHVDLFFNDAEEWEKCAADDIVYEVPCMRELGVTEIVGLDAVRGLLARSAWRNKRYENIRIHPMADESQALLECTIYGESPQGAVYDQVVCARFEVRDGKIARVREYIDPFRMGTTLGVDMNLDGLAAALGAAADAHAAAGP